MFAVVSEMIEIWKYVIKINWSIIMEMVRVHVRRAEHHVSGANFNFPGNYVSKRDLDKNALQSCGIWTAFQAEFILIQLN